LWVASLKDEGEAPKNEAVEDDVVLSPEDLAASLEEYVEAPKAGEEKNKEPLPHSHSFTR
jgi:hypothetical protein